MSYSSGSSRIRWGFVLSSPYRMKTARSRGNRWGKPHPPPPLASRLPKLQPNFVPFGRSRVNNDTPRRGWMAIREYQLVADLELARGASPAPDVSAAVRVPAASWGLG